MPRRAFSVLCGVVLLAGCVDAPRPFAHRTTGQMPIELLQLDDTSPVLVRIEGGVQAAEPALLAQSMVTQLEAVNVAAMLDDGKTAGYRLSGQLTSWTQEGQSEKMVITWRLDDAGGRIIGTFDQPATAPLGSWMSGNQKLADDIAVDAAPRLAAFIQEPDGALVSAPDASLLIVPVVGAPGDGNITLTTAISFTLRKKTEVPLVAATEVTESTYQLAGEVEVTPLSATQERIQIVWNLLTPAGTRVGSVKQANTLPAGSTEGSWGQLSYLIAQSAAPGIVTLFKRAQDGALSAVQR